MFRFLLRASLIAGLMAATPLTAQVATPGAPLDLPEVIQQVGQPQIVALPDGRFVLAGRQFNVLRSADLHLLTVQTHGDVLGPWNRPRVGDLEGGGYLLPTSDHVLYLDIESQAPFAPERLSAQAIDPNDGNNLAPTATVFQNVSPWPWQVHGAPLGDGTSVVGWVLFTGGVAAQRIDGDGQVLGEPIELTDMDASQVRVAARSDGGFLIVWRENGRAGAWGRAFNAQGVGGSAQRILSEAEDPIDLDLAPLGGDGFALVWSGSQDPGVFVRRLDAFGQPFSEAIRVSPSSDRRADQPVAASAGGRVWLAWREASGIYLRAMQSSGSMGPVAVVPPRQAGSPQSEPNLAAGPDGNLLMIWEEGASFGTLEGRPIEVSDVCMDGDTELCLHAGRFRVEVDWTDYDGETGPGRVVPFQSSDSGLFWFFQESNWEVMVKVINGCDFNGFYWIFSAATTDVAYDLKVTDTVTGLEQIYSNGLGEPAPANTDTMALMSCDHGPP